MSPRKVKPKSAPRFCVICERKLQKSPYYFILQDSSERWFAEHKLFETENEAIAYAADTNTRNPRIFGLNPEYDFSVTYELSVKE